MEKIKFFKSLGFNEYEAKTLVSLIKLKISTPKQISLDSGVPQNKLYQILKKFESLNLLALIPSETKKYKIINLKSFIKIKIKEKEKNLKNIKQNSKKLEELKEQETQHIFSLIKGQRAIMNKLAEENIKVKKEILGVQRNWKVWGEGLRAMEKAIKKGVKVKLIGVINKDTIKRANEWKIIGCQIKKYNEKFSPFPLRFSIFDNKEARITIGKPEIPEPKDYITIWTTSKPLINMLKKQFEQMWKEFENF